MHRPDSPPAVWLSIIGATPVIPWWGDTQREGVYGALGLAAHVVVVLGDHDGRDRGGKPRIYTRRGNKNRFPPGCRANPAAAVHRLSRTKLAVGRTAARSAAVRPRRRCRSRFGEGWK